MAAVDEDRLAALVAAGLAYDKGLVTILMYVGNACTFLLGYFIFAARWRRTEAGASGQLLLRPQ